jgi:N-methylhydantoinase B
VGLFSSTSHVVDVGGRGFGPDARQVFEEGLNIPILPLLREGSINQDLLVIVRANVREPVQVQGDLFSLAACNDEGCRRLKEMMEEFGLNDLQYLADHILEVSKNATLKNLTRLPQGSWHNTLDVDGYDQPVHLEARLSINDSGVDIDFKGTSPASGFGINVPPAYTRAYSAFAVKCIAAPEIPNNAGSLEPIRTTIPQGSILNAPRPYPVAVRHVIGHMLPDLIFGCLHQASQTLHEKEQGVGEAFSQGMPAEGAGTIWNPQLRGGKNYSFESGDQEEILDFNIVTFNSGGTGARPNKDGLSATAFPSGVRTMPVEATENAAPVLFRRKEFRPDSGGPGRWRGGLGQVMEIEGKDQQPFNVLAMFDRVHHPPKGRNGGDEGVAGRVSLVSGKKLRVKGEQAIPRGDRLRLELPGGGGFGNPYHREPERVLDDLKDGLISSDAATTSYGVVFHKDGSIHDEETLNVRKNQK